MARHWGWAIGVVLAMAAGLARAEQITLQLATPIPDGTIWNEQLRRYCDRVNELSNGDIKIEIFGNSQLGKMGDTLRNTIQGRIDMWSGTIPAIGTVTSEFSLLSLPYLFENTEEAGCILPKLLPTMQEMTGGKYHLLALAPLGTQSLGLKRQVRAPKDIKGMKIRVAPLKPTINLFASIGANGVPLDPADSVTALSTGMVAGFDTSPTFYMTADVNKMAPVFIDTRHNYNTFAIVISNRAWDRLDNEQKAIMSLALDELDFETMRVEIDDAEKSALMEHVRTGGTLVELSSEERAEWVKAGRATWEATKSELRGDVEGFMQTILEARAACE